MLALLLCEDRECRGAFEAEGSPDAIQALHCDDCGGPLSAIGYADASPSERAPGGTAEMRRTA